MKKFKRLNNPDINDLKQERREKIVEVAKKHIEQKLSQSDIAKEMDVSQAEISRLLKLGEEYNLIIKAVNYQPIKDLEKELVNKFKTLNAAKVSPSPINDDIRRTGLCYEELSMEAANYLLGSTTKSLKIGIGCGKTLRKFIQSVGELERHGTTLPPGTSIYPLAIMKTKNIIAESPASLVANLIGFIPGGIGKAFNLPKTEKNDQLKEAKENISDLEACDAFIIGIGSVDLSQGKILQRTDDTPVEFNSMAQDPNTSALLRKYGAIGETSYRPFDKDGKDIIATHQAEFDKLQLGAITTPLKVLHDCIKKRGGTVLAIAGGNSKYEAIYHAVKSGLCNVLCTDVETAKFLIKCK